MRIILLLCIALPLCTFGDHLITDFETGSNYTDDGGSWHVFTDAYDNGASTITSKNKRGYILPYAQGYNSERAMTFSYKLDKGNYEWGPYAELQLKLNGDQSYDASAYQGLSYWYKGVAHTISLNSNNIEDWSYYECLVPASEEWREAKLVLPESFSQPNWGKKKPLDLSDLSAIGWRISGVTGDTGTLTIDNITLLDSLIMAKQYQLKVRTASIPPKPTLPDFSKLTNPLQEVAAKHLNQGVSLHNWLEENAPFKDFRYDEADIKRFAEQGFKGVRIPIDLDLYVIDKDKVIAGEAAFAMDDLIWTPLDSMMSWTEKYGLSLTIDYHQYDASLNRTSVYDKGYRAMAANAWKTVAKRYRKDKREDLFYELTNEPGISDDVPDQAWRILAEEMLDSIRTVDKKRVVIYGPSRWYDLQKLIETTPFQDERVIYSFHYYEPFIFTHQGASWTNMGSTRNTPYPYSKEEWDTEYFYFGIQEGTPDWVKEQYQNYYRKGNYNALMTEVMKAKQWAIEHNVVVINNEFGAHPVSKPEHLIAYFTDIIGIFEELEIPWQVWFGPFDEEGKLLPNMGKALGLE